MRTQRDLDMALVGSPSILIVDVLINRPLQALMAEYKCTLQTIATDRSCQRFWNGGRKIISDTFPTSAVHCYALWDIICNERRLSGHINQ